MSNVQDIKDAESELIEVINISADKVVFIIDSYRHVLKPKEISKIPTVYAMPRKLQPDRDPIPSVIELETGGKVLPVTHSKAKHLYEAVKRG